MELRHLEYFHAVADLASFTKAAEQLHVSQPAITTAVKHLEEELGVTLFVRDKRRVMLTYEGKLFLERTQPLLAQLKLSVLDIQKLSTDYDQILNIGVIPVAGAPLTAALYGGFLQSCPNVRFQLVEMGSFDILDALDRGEIDLGYLVLPEQAEHAYHTRSIEKGVIRAVMNRERLLATQKTVSIEQLAKEPIIYLSGSAFVTRKVDEAFSSRGLKQHVICKPMQMFTTFNLIQHNAGIFFALGNGYTAVMRTENIVSIPLDPPIPYEIGFVWKKEKKLNQAARQCIAYAEKQLRG